eukprot:14028805-Alexandrium_andersonii.AAC.1
MYFLWFGGLGSRFRGRIRNECETHRRALRCLIKLSSGQKRKQPEGAAVRARPTGQTALSAALNR